MNNVTLIGRLTREPELRYTPSGVATTRFTLAVNRVLSKEKKQEAENNGYPTADFISCTAWNKTAETIANYVQKGHRLAVTGRIQTGKYDKDGQTIYTTDVVVSNMEFLESANSNNNNNNNFNTDEGMYQINNDDIPF